MAKEFKKHYQGDPTLFGRTAVLFGGLSAEREISLKSGRAVLAALQQAGVNAFAIDVQANVVEQLQTENIDRAFIALHGPGGEDGKIQALLGLLAIPFTGSDHASSAVAMDKWKTKLIWNAVNLPTPKSLLLSGASDWEQVLASLGGEVFVKPIHEGSSIGMSCVNTANGLQGAFAQAGKFDAAVMAEARVVGKEFSVSILNGVALPPIGLVTKSEFYDFDAKYVSDETIYLCPCGLAEKKTRELQALALSAFEAVGCRGWGRVDVMMNKEETFELLEVNTVPGMTDHSLVPMAAKELGMSFGDLVLEILCQTLETK